MLTFFSPFTSRVPDLNCIRPLFNFLVGTGPCSKTTTHVGTIPKQLVLCGQKWDKIGNKSARGQDAGALQRPTLKS